MAGQVKTFACKPDDLRIHMVKREYTPISCPLIFMCVSWCTSIQKQIKNIKLSISGVCLDAGKC